MKNIKRIMSFVLVLILIFSTASVSAVSNAESFKYKNEIVQMLDEHFNFTNGNTGINLIHYSEDYEYYSPENSATGDEATPDYVLITIYFDMQLDAQTTMLFGDYIMIDEPSTKTPYAFGKCVYVPAENVGYALWQVYDKNNIEGIENIFTEAGLGILVGDMDKDRNLTVKDSTYIQKCIAGLESFDKDDYVGYYDKVYSDKENAPLYVSDFNRDGERNIKDATAIQKHIAGLEY